MFTIKTLNTISQKGLSVFNDNNYQINNTVATPDAIVLRSAVIDSVFDNLIAIARAGTGVNNIPVDTCTSQGIVVFNTPGANANSVKELVISGMLLSSRKIIEGMNWVRALAGPHNIEQAVEEGKKNFAGPEIMGKKLTVIGLGSIGAVVANTAVDLGMEVLGYDPYISVDSAWGLRAQIIRANTLEDAVSDCDFISLHIPLTDNTRNSINADLTKKMRKGVRILNFARGALVNDDDMIAALKSGQVARYITDFPSKKLLPQEHVLPTPHLGASTPEAEENCAIMAGNQLFRYLETGNITNSVNFPTIEMDFLSHTRLLILNKNIPAVVGQITSILASEKINISGMINKHRNEVAVTIINIDGEISEDSIRRVEGIDGIIRVRLIRK